MVGRLLQGRFAENYGGIARDRFYRTPELALVPRRRSGRPRQPAVMSR